MLKEQPRNGYQIMQELEQRSRGTWRPSSGSVYPALQQLEDEGLVETESTASGRTFRLTEKGRAYIDEHRDESDAPWDSVTETAGDDWVEWFGLIRQIGMATMQVLHAGTPDQVSAARQVLTRTRQKLYGILAEGGENGDDE